MLSQQIPQFNNASYTSVFNQNLLAGHVIQNVTCTFSGTANYRFGSTDSQLAIDQVSGMISLALDALDLSVGTRTVIIECYDVDNTVNSNLAILTVTRVEENQHLPNFLHPSTVTLTLSEDIPVNSLLVKLNATDEDLGMFGEIQFTIPAGNDMNLFSIDITSGQITLQATLDFETATRHQFIGSASNLLDPVSGLVETRSLVVIVNVQDVDDSPPTFQSASFEILVPETVLNNVVAGMNYPRPPPGFLITECTDLDTPPEQISYSVLNTDSIYPLILNETTGSFSVDEDLDYETRTSFTFSVVCYDNSLRNNSDTTTVNIAVLPINEEVPVIVTELSTVVFLETASVGDVIATANPESSTVRNKYSFTDTDDGPDGNITYTLDETSADSQFFLLDVISGDLTITEELDSDDETVMLAGSVRRFLLRIRGCDEFPVSTQAGSLCPNFEFNIFVFSVNEFDPIILQEDYSLSFPESFPTGGVVLSAGDVSCTDQDRGTGALGVDHVAFSNPSPTVSTVFHIDSQTGEIQLRGSFDYETDISYGFEIRCYDNAGREDRAVVVVEILPENDNRPVFNPRNYIFNVSRTTPSNRFPIGRVFATDADVGFGGNIQYSVQSNGFVDISDNGELLLFNSVFNISQTTISFLAFVNDDNFNSTDDVLVVIQLTEGNSEHPQFIAGSTAIQLSELAMPGETVLDLMCIDPDSGVNGEIRYFFSGGNTDGAFSVDETTGRITVNNVLTLPENSTVETYTLSVTCEDMGVPVFFDDATVFVSVFKDDSNPPVISNETINLFISEDTQTNTVVATIEAVDIDSEQLNYRLENQSLPGVFFIDPSTGDLRLASPLDRETVNYYQMTVIVTEVRIIIGPERSDSALINIFIRDVNDNKPVCTPPSYVVSVDETVGVGEAILQLQCSDPDLEANGLLTYTLADDLGVLDIANATGEITVVDFLNNTEQTVLDVLVTVADRGFPVSMRTEVQVSVLITSSNRNQPMFTNLPSVINVSEAQSLQDIIFTVKATDPDRGSFGQISFGISGEGQSNFGIFSNTGGLFLISKLDFFNQHQHIVNITAEDSDFLVSELLTVNVLDANEFSPVCDSDQQRLTIPESIDPSEIIFQRLLCTDDDQGSNGQLFYNISSGNLGDVFQILNDGTITTVQVLDYEDIQQYELVIQVSDGGSPTSSILKSLDVIVNPVNEFTPEFEQDIYEQTVLEGTSVGTNVLQVIATDRDRSSHLDGQLVFSIVGLEQPFFTVTRSGFLQVASELDREAHSSFLFMILATDQGTPPRSNTTSISITISDIDDNPPVFTEDLYLFLVNNSAVRGTAIGIVSCVDIDAGINSEVIYSFDETDTDASLFTIGSTGVIELLQDLSINRAHTFTVLCTGPSPLNHSDSTTVSIRVLLNSTISFFPNNVYEVPLQEDTVPVVDIVVANASSSTGATLTYRQLNLANQFEVDEISGVVRLIAPLDFELVESYSLRVEAMDGGNPPTTNEALIQVVVVNVNDESPSIITEPMDIFVEEGPVNFTQTLQQYQCLDGDKGILGQVSFHIVGGNSDNIFTISTSGTLSLVGDLDHETVPEYTLDIVCQDGGQPPRSTSVSIPVNVVAINDNRPLFTAVSDIAIVESLQTGVEIGIPIVATDLDTAPHNIIQYSIISGNTEPPTFAISTSTGQLSLLRSLNYEVITEYSLGIRAEDSGGLTPANQFLVLSDTVILTIRVIDINDNEPIFSERSYSGTVLETAVPGDLVNVGQPIRCTDADSGTNGEIVYSITGNAPFNIQSNGVITVAGSLDYETQIVYRIFIQCSDPDQSVRAFMLIILLDVDEHGPEFIMPFFNFSVPENASPGTSVGTVQATDRDIAQILMYTIVDEMITTFVLDSTSGNIILQSSIDFEQQDQQQYTLTIEVVDTAGNTDTAVVVIEIENINDNLPTFSDTRYFFSVRENSPVSSIVGSIECSDLDNEAEGLPLNYSIASPGVPFRIENSGTVLVDGDIDLEMVGRYIIQAMCTDSGGISAFADITIDILPFNDFPPIFISPSVPSSEIISEGIAIGTTIRRIIAFDRDIVNYRVPVYSIISGNDNDTFSIGSSNGFLRVERNIDREEQALYVLILKAANVIPPDDASGSLPLFSTLQLTIIVSDINDNFPVISPTDPQPVTLIESNSTFIDIAFFVCSDLDAGHNGLTNFSISNINLAETFEISDAGVVRTTARISTNVIVDITCSDNGNLPRSTTVSLAVNSVVVNEHAPMFSMASYSFSIPEDYPLNTDFLCLNASDMDGSDNPDGIIKYSLVFEHAQDGFSRFSIHENTGCLFVALSLNYDDSNSYIYQVTATDTGDEPLSDSVQLMITIQDTIPAPPVFQSRPYRQTLFENEESGTQVIQVVCIDIDDNDSITYSITDGNADAIFSINSTSGFISLSSNKTVDYEQNTLHLLSVSCIDIHNLRDSTLVIVTVSPVNEFTPTFLSGPFAVEENSILGAEVIQLQYFDGDVGLDGDVVFELIGVILNDAFSVSSDGSIFVNGNLDREALDFYSFEVRISDLSMNPLHRRSTLNQINITILDQNDNKPVFQLDSYNFGPLDGNETIGFVVGNVLCSDTDFGTNSMITYSIIDPSLISFLFDIDPETGDIFVSTDVETRQLDDIIFFVECRDSGPGISSDTSRVLIQVQEVNRNAPEFLNDSYFVQIPEDTEVLNDVIITVTAQDGDDGLNGQVRYALESSLDFTFFIDEDTGDISLLSSLDFENRAEYLLTVEARDGAIDSVTQMISRVNVTIEVSGINEFTPECLDPIYVAIINRTTLGRIINFECLDSDAGIDGVITYRIVNGDSNEQFNVSDDGFLVVPNFISPDATLERFILTIQISDNSTPSRQTEIEAILIYSFDNLNTPEFELSLYNFNLTELIVVGEIFGNVQATDFDPGLQGQITYLIAGTRSFRIDPFSGDMFVGQTLDWETSPTHMFTIIAEDNDPFSPRRGVVTVKINVINENDNDPQCLQVFYSVEILSNATIGDPVLFLECEDLDRTPLQYEFTNGMVRQSTSFAIDRATGRIYVAGPLTPSANTILTVLVIGEGGETVEVTISVQVRFINVESPVFEQGEFFLLISEDTQLLSVVGIISAIDFDSRQSDLVYSLRDVNASSEFFVNPSTGEIVLTSPLDFETTQEYSFSISVMDSGSYDGTGQLMDTASLNVNVTNANDNPPVLSNDGIYGVTVSETTSEGTELLTITCVDNDAPPYASPIITSSNLLESPFSLVLTEQGVYNIEVSGPLLGPSSYVVFLTCNDNGGLRADGQVYIFVQEILAPVYTQPQYEWFLSETAETGTEYSQLQASSNDGSSVRYMISDGNDESIFYIDSPSGVISLVTSVDYETQRTHGLIIRAVDGKSRQSSVLLIVHVLDENDEVQLTPPSALLTVTQNSPVGFPIGLLECTDQDIIDNITLFSFRFIPGSDLFSVDDFGVVRLEGVLESTPVYSLPVVCFNLNNPDDISMGVITIEVEFVNLNHPEFNFPLYSFSIREDVEPLTFVGQVSAFDRDVGSFGEVAYDITDGNPNSFFIEASTGRIGVLTSLDRESVDVYTLTVVAFDGGISALQDNRLNETTIVVVMVEDANDNTPQPEQLSYVQSITTNHSILTSVLSVSCSDPDLFNNGMIGYSVAPDSVENFIVQSDGTVLLAREQTNQAVHNFFVVCTDQGNQSLSASALVTVTVDFISLTAPVFDQNEYNVTIDEDVPIASTIIRVHAESTDPSVDLIYSIDGGNNQNRFHINPLSGAVLVTNELDASVQREYVLTISATITDRTALSSFTNIHIFIADLNDNNPQFFSPFYSANVTEHSTSSTPVVQVSCTDVDVDADISYSIQYSLDLFSITPEGLIVVAEDIDFESNTTHTFEVLCTDGGDTPRLAATSVRIDVDPVNEFVPTFTQSRYNFTASENSFGALIGQLQAIDNDAGSQGDIKYVLQDPANTSVVFVNPQTGEVLVANNLDYEMQTFLDLIVIARDGGGAESYALLHIDVQNVNDVQPVISPITVISTITSDNPAGFPVQSFTCSDADGSQTSLMLSSGNNLELFQLDSNNVLLWTGQGEQLDANAVISLNLVCEDLDSPNQRVFSHIAVRIQVNDALPPVFIETAYIRNVSESSEIGTVVLTVSATSASMNISYSFFNLPDSFPFSIDEASGEITLTMLLNRETGSLYTFFIGATDLDTFGVGVVLVEIIVVDVNDNAPVIIPSEQTVTLPENFELSTDFIRFMCSDSDSGSNGETNFELTGGNYNNTFLISHLLSRIGSVSLNLNLDFEIEDQYSILVECSDRGSPPLTTTAILTVVVSGVNEFEPSFLQDNYIFLVNETFKAGDVVGKVVATDFDEGEDGVIEYDINLILDHQHFTINSIGEIRTTSLTLNASISQQLQISVGVTDRGGLSDVTLVTVIVEDINSPPILSEFGNYFVTLSSNQSTPVTFFNLFCYDTDVGNNSDLILQFRNIPTGIIIQTDSVPGLITATLILNYTLDAGIYNLPLSCFDNGAPALSVSTTVTIQIQGVNTAPTFDHGPVFISILENTLPGTLLYSVNATDVESNVTYAITGGSGRGTFSINPHSGHISLFLPLDYETVPEYVISVTAYDQSIANPLSANLQVSIDVTNVNDEPPSIQPQGIQQIALGENEQPGFVVQTYTCQDPDGVQPVTFSLSPRSPDVPFSLRQSGELLLEASLDFETVPLYELEIMCVDSETRMGEGVNLRSSVTLVVVVVPVNSHPPVFQPPFEFFVSERNVPGDIIAQVHAADLDQRGEITYSSLSHPDLFVVQHLSGDIILLNTIDYEADNREYSLLVEASDNDNIQGVNPLTASLNITIQITDANDNPPVCQTLITFQITSGTYSFVQLAHLSCSDIDSGINSALVYEFRQPLPSIDGGELVINRTSGEVGFRGQVSTPGALVFYVTVSDGGDIPQRSITTIVVLVESSDEMAIRFVPNSFNISVFEDVPVGTVIFDGISLQTALVNPLGSDTFFSLRPSIGNGGSFIADPGSGNITLVNNNLLDFESDKKDFTLIIDVVVGSVEESSAVIQLSLLDSNDNRPRFIQSVFTAEIFENQDEGTFILQVQASDFDSGSNGMFTYLIEDSADFYIDPDSGIITSLLPLDRETNERYSIVVVARDFGIPSLNGSALVTITVLDENDEPPMFDSSLYILDTNNLTPPGTHVLTLDVTDNDVTGTLFFQMITDDIITRDLFTVNALSGIVSRGPVVFPVDHKDRYNFTVQVSDGISFDMTTIVIYVASVTTDSVVFEENARDQTYDVRGFLVLQNFQISSNATYEVTEGDVSNEFILSSVGVLSTRDALDRESIAEYTLTIHVEDDSSSNNIDVFVTITVQDQNDNAPTFSSEEYLFCVAEGTYQDSLPIGSVTATDIDKSGTNAATIEYSIAGAIFGTSDEFGVHPLTGEVFLKQSSTLDRERYSNHTLVIRARDFGEPNSLVSSVAVVVCLNDTNDNDPEFVPIDVVEYILLLGKVEVLAETMLDNILAILPKGVQQSQTRFMFLDPDSTSTITASLRVITGENKYKLITNMTENTATLVSSDKIVEDDSKNTLLQIVLSDEANEDKFIMRNISLVFDDTFIVPPTGSLSEPPPPFFQTDIGIAVIVIICMLLVSLLFVFLCMCCYCYMRQWRKNGPVRNR